MYTKLAALTVLGQLSSLDLDRCTHACCKGCMHTWKPAGRPARYLGICHHGCATFPGCAGTLLRDHISTCRQHAMHSITPELTNVITCNLGSTDTELMFQAVLSALCTSRAGTRAAAGHHIRAVQMQPGSIDLCILR